MGQWLRIVGPVGPAAGLLTEYRAGNRRHGGRRDIIVDDRLVHGSPICLQLWLTGVYG